MLLRELSMPSPMTVTWDVNSLTFTSRVLPSLRCRTASGN